MNPQPEPFVESVDNLISPTESDADRRNQSDRRQEPTSPWAAFPPAGQRMKNRRVEEHRRPYYTDRFSPAIFAAVLLLIVATLVDAGLTIYVLDGGGSEANPLMGRLLNHSIEAFVIGKYLLTVVGLPVLLIFRNHYLFGTQLRVGHLIPASVALYAVLIGYQVILIDQRIGW
jgi:hypothetical protein